LTSLMQREAGRLFVSKIFGLVQIFFTNKDWKFDDMSKNNKPIDDVSIFFFLHGLNQTIFLLYSNLPINWGFKLLPNNKLRF
jgi:hypothetical protein